MGQADFLFVFFLVETLDLGLTPCKGLNSRHGVIIVIRKSLFHFLLLLFLLLIKHFCDFIEKLVEITTCLCRNTVIWHLISLYQLL